MMNFPSKSYFRELFDKVPDPSSVFPEQISQAIDVRNSNIVELKRLFQEKCYSNCKELQNCLGICDAILKGPVTLAVVGRLNAGKSMLVSALLDWQIILPSSDEVTTGRFTRFVYSDTPVIRKIKIGEWHDSAIVKNYGESIESEECLDEELLNDVLNLQTQVGESSNESLMTVIEIGIDTELLKTGLTILDCPGLDESEVVSDIEFAVLREMMPSVFCYIYDHRQGFTLRDGVRLKEMIKEIRVDKWLLRTFEMVVVANKCDSIDETATDTQQSERSLFNQRDEAVNIRKNCPWIHVFTEPYFDKDAILPSLPLSTAKLFLSEYDENDEEIEFQKMLKTLQYNIAHKIISQSKSILRKLTYALSENSVDLFFFLKSLLLENDLVDLINAKCNDDEYLLLDFTRGFKLFGVNYRDDNTHITHIRRNIRMDYQEEKRRIFYEKLFYRNELIVYENENRSDIYLIEKERPHVRVLDCLDRASLDHRIDFIIAIYGSLGNLFRSVVNFRPDNVYINDDNCIYVGCTVPNKCELPVIPADRGPVSPFHLHPQVRSVCPYKDEGLERIQMFYTFGWMVWILLGGGNVDSTGGSIHTRIESLQEGAFPHYPRQLDELMALCFNVNLSDYDNRYILREKCYKIREIFLRLFPHKFIESYKSKI